MPRSLPQGLLDVLKAGRAESHATLKLLVPDPASGGVRSYYLATAAITYNGVNYQNTLSADGTITQSLTRAADRTTVEVQNVDTLFGVEMLRIQNLLYGA